MKTHFKLSTGPACGRGKRSTDHAHEVTCGLCMRDEHYRKAMIDLNAKKAQQFAEQIPTRVKEPWREGSIECGNCGSDLFRIGDRTCYGHYENYHCAKCGNIESRLTEIGMSF